MLLIHVPDLYLLHIENQSGKWVQRVPRSLHAKLAKQAKREHVSLNTLVVSILSEAMGLKQITNTEV
jgi:hypothetical protein